MSVAELIEKAHALSDDEKGELIVGQAEVHRRGGGVGVVIENVLVSVIPPTGGEVPVGSVHSPGPADGVEQLIGDSLSELRCHELVVVCPDELEVGRGKAQLLTRIHEVERNIGGKPHRRVVRHTCPFGFQNR